MLLFPTCISKGDYKTIREGIVLRPKVSGSERSLWQCCSCNLRACARDAQHPIKASVAQEVGTSNKRQTEIFQCGSALQCYRVDTGNWPAQFNDKLAWC